MIGLMLFRIFSGISLFILILYAIKYLISFLRKREKTVQLIIYFESVIKNLVFITSTVALIIVLLFCSIFPYIAQEKDYMLVSEYTSNISLYRNYSNEYAEGARKQIAEYQKMQSDMARTATVVQLQFFSQQQDSVGDALTNEIRRFQTLIMEQELAINQANSRILRRPFNKWYFGIN